MLEQNTEDFDYESFQDERPFDVTITRDLQLQDFYMHERGSDVYIDIHFIISGKCFRFLEIEMQDYTLRVEPLVAGDEKPRTRRYILTKISTSGTTTFQTMDFDELFLLGKLPIVGGQMLKLMNDDEFIRLEHRVGRTQVRITPKKG